MKKQIVTALITAAIFSSPASADYTLVLKNGRRITVPSYREETGMIKFPGLGGEIGISKDQIEAIQQTGEQERTGLLLPNAKPSPPPAVTREPTGQQKISIPPTRVKEPTAEEKLAEQRAKEEKEYVKRVEEITQRIRDERSRYGAETTGVTGPEPGFFTTDEAFRRHQDDLMSRLIDAQNNPAGPGNTGKGALTPPDNRVPPSYTERERQLSDLRYRLDQLEQERKRLIEEMKQKHFDAGSLFLE